MKLKHNRFERVRIIGARALQISMGAPILIKRPKDQYSSIEIAQQEYESNKLPITIKRSETVKKVISEESSDLEN